MPRSLLRPGRHTAPRRTVSTPVAAALGVSVFLTAWGGTCAAAEALLIGRDDLPAVSVSSPEKRTPEPIPEPVPTTSTVAPDLPTQVSLIPPLVVTNDPGRLAPPVPSPCKAKAHTLKATTEQVRTAYGKPNAQHLAEDAATIAKALFVSCGWVTP